MTRWSVGRLALSLLLTALASPAAVSGAAPSEADAGPTEALLTAAEGGSVAARMELARRRSAAGDLDGALEQVSRALAAAPSSEEVIGVYARLSLAADRPVQALSALEPLARIAPEVAEHHYLLGVARMQAGDVGGALAPLREATRLQPERPLHWIALGLALNDRDRFDEARRALQTALESAPEHVEALAALAEAEEGAGHLEAAQRHAERALSRDADHATANLVLAMVAMKRHDHRTASRYLERAVAADPELAKAHYQLGLAYARLGRPELSRHHLDLYRRIREEREERLLSIRQGGMGP